MYALRGHAKASESPLGLLAQHGLRPRRDIGRQMKALHAWPGVDLVARAAHEKREVVLLCAGKLAQLRDRE